MSARRGRIVRGSVLSFGALIVSFGFALVTSVIIARCLERRGRAPIASLYARQA